MPVPSILDPGVFLLGALLIACARPGAHSPRVVRIRCRFEAYIPAPDAGSLAGVPRRLLLSERSDPGALLRDMLLSGPPPRNW